MGTHGTVYRVDTFTVPPSARDDFLTNVHRTHDHLRALPGFVHDLILEKPSDDGAVVIMTLAAWENADVFESAREAMRRRHQQDGFDPRALIDRLGITADLAEYTETV